MAKPDTASWSEEPQEWALRVARERSIPEPNTGCWLWTGATSTLGYAHASYRGRTVILTGRIVGLPIRPNHLNTTESLIACHRCDTKSCVNPDHLFVGTNMTNARDYHKKRRSGPLVDESGEVACVNGHPRTVANTRIDYKGLRSCRICRNAPRPVSAKRRAKR